MRLRRWPLACFAVVAACSVGEEPKPYDWRADDRLKSILVGGVRSGHFEGDTGDVLPLMVEKIAKGQSEVQNHYRGELARGDGRCVELIGDLIQRHSSARSGTLVIGNCLGVLGLMDHPDAVVVVRMMLSHPAESVRSSAIRAMARLAETDDYEVLESLMPTVSGEVRRVLVQALGRSDANRLAGDMAAWMEAGEDSAMLVLAARAVAKAGAGEALADGVLDHEAAHHPALRPYLAGALAAAGDGAAGQILVDGLQDEDLYVRTRCLEAASMAGLDALLLELVSADPSENLRVLAAEGVAKLMPGSMARAALRAGVMDAAITVRQACLRGLLAAGDAQGGDHFVGLLFEGPSELGPALLAVRGLWARNPNLADRAAEALMSQLSDMEERSVREREPWLQCLGLVPGREGAEWLLELARTSKGVSHKLSTHRWIVLQISNGGPLAREVLARSWRSEEDAERRMDYLWGASLTREADALEFLIEVVMDNKIPDHERLYAADCLAKLGSTPRVAPILKRACLDITDPGARPAFEALLWTWYGQTAER